MATLESKLSALAAAALAAHGLVLVEARLTGGSTAGSAKKGKLTLSVLAETPEGQSPTVEDCTAASRTLSAQLDVADILTTAYVLEVGSPGLERPLTSADDCRRFAGKQAKLTFTRARQIGKVGVGSVVGMLLPSEGDTVTLKPVDQPEALTVAWDEIRHAHLSPSKDELAALMKAANARTKEILN